MSPGLVLRGPVPASERQEALTPGPPSAASSLRPSEVLQAPLGEPSWWGLSPRRPVWALSHVGRRGGRRFGATGCVTSSKLHNFSVTWFPHL